MMKQPDPRKRHDYSVFVADVDDIAVADRTAGLGDILNAVFFARSMLSLKGKKASLPRRRPEGRDPVFSFSFSENGRFFGKQSFPLAVGGNVLVFVGQIDIDGRVARGAADVIEFKAKYLRVAAQPPPVGFSPSNLVQWMRLCWPAPMPMAWPSFTKQTELDCVYLG
jgi:hypothetical protein